MSKEAKGAPLSPQDEIREAVKTRLASGNDEVKEVVVQKLVKVEHDKRVGLLEKGFEVLTNLETEFKRASKPDMELTTGEGVVQGFSPDLTKKRKDLKEKIEKAEAALGSAIKDKNWEPLKNLVENAPKA